MMPNLGENEAQKLIQQARRRLRRSIDWLDIEETPTDNRPPVEIHSGALIENDDGTIDVEANMADGLIKVIGGRDPRKQLVRRDAQSEFSESWRSWVDPASQVIRLQHHEFHLLPDTMMPADLIRGLVERRGIARQDIVFEIENTKFTGDSRTEVIAALREYIEENRDSNDRDELVGVTSAIRKCVAMMPVDDVGWAATLLEAGNRAAVPIEVELEVAKMVLRKFAANPPEELNTESTLAARFAEIAEAYLHPRVFPRDRHSTVAMVAIQAVFVLLGSQLQTLVESVNDSPFGWFRQQLRRRMERVVSEWQGRGAKHVDALDGFVQQLVD